MGSHRGIGVVCGAWCVFLLAGCQGMPKLTWKKEGEMPRVLPGADGQKQIAEEEPRKMKEAPPEAPTSKMLVDFGYVQMSMQHLPEAADLFERAARLEPKNEHAYVGLAKAKVAMGHPDQAIAMLTTASKKLPKSAPIWNEIAVAHAKRNNLPEAVKALDKARKFDPDSDLYVSNQAAMYTMMGDIEKAHELYASVMSEGNSRFEIARILGGQKKNEDCRRQLELAVGAEPTHVAAQQMLQEVRNSSLQPVGYERPE